MKKRKFKQAGERQLTYRSEKAEALIFGASRWGLWAYAVFFEGGNKSGVAFNLESARALANEVLDEIEVQT